MWWVLVALVFAAANSSGIEDKNYWARTANKELNAALHMEHNVGIAKNVILFIGDGMGINTLTAARIYKGNGNEQTKLTFENFPHMGLLKTYCTNKQVPDSAATATALLCGVKANYRTAGVDANVKNNDWRAALNPKHHVDSIIKWAQDAGKDTGFVTTTRVTHATPSALYAHIAERTWECEDTIPSNANAKDIARQLIEDEPGRSIKVIMGGGRQCLVSRSVETDDDPIDTWGCSRKDGRNLIQQWRDDKKARNYTHQVLSNSMDLDSLDTHNTEYVIGIFANGHLRYESDQDRSSTGTPFIEKMTSAAIKILKRNPKGFLLVVEGGLIDMAHHKGMARHALHEATAMDTAVAAALAATAGQSDTLVIVTSDHSHALTITGYAPRGNNIMGLAGNSQEDHIPYTTLNYATGDKSSFKYSIVNGTEMVRKNPEEDDYTSFDYHQQAAIIAEEALHGGGDVAVYATGPMAHLFHSNHEQNYVAHVIAYAARIGPHREEHRSRSEAGSYREGHESRNEASSHSVNIMLPLLLVIQFLVLL